MDGRPDREWVWRTYDRIADHFAATRPRPWPEVEAFLDGVEPVGLGLDVGCGNGRHAELLAGHARRTVALDASRGVLAVAGERTGARDLALLQADAASLPVASGAVGLAVYVATLHHLPERSFRVASLDELARALAPGGRALVSAWSTTHDRFEADAGFDTTVDWTLPDGERVPRFYHIYDPDEFRADLGASDLDTLEVFLSSGNCYGTVAAGGKEGKRT